jgi:hypothetical protein
MLPFLKKSKEQAEQPLMPAWHPNFRNYEKLPDTKVVRTAFFANGLVVFVAVALALFFAYQEYQISGLSGQIATWEEQIERDREPSTQAVALFKKFQAEEKIVNEVEAFATPQLRVSAYILKLGETLPADIAIRHFDYRDTGVVLRGLVRGAPDQATGQATAFVDQLRRDADFGELFATAELTGVNRDPVTGRLHIEISLKFKTEGAKK